MGLFFLEYIIITSLSPSRPS